MKIRRELAIAFGFTTALSLAVGAASVHLLNRMTPAIGKIMAENGRSIEGAEIMLRVLVDTAGGAASNTQRARFLSALERVRVNITESEEPAIISAIDGHARAALEGEPEAAWAAIRQLTRLVEVNRRAMERADVEAQRLGVAGAWAIVLLLSVGLSVAFVAYRRLVRQVVEPLQDAAETVHEFGAGNRFRRCARYSESVEIAQLQRSVNKLLDRLT